MKLTITRFKNIVDGTLGKFTLSYKDNVILDGYTLEPKGEDTIARGTDTRIPEGIYNVVYHKSPRFSRVLPLLYNDKVPKDRYILIHAGNYPKDTEGCILVGASYNDKGVYNSVYTLNKLLTLTGKQPFIVEIRNKL